MRKPLSEEQKERLRVACTRATEGRNMSHPLTPEQKDRLSRSRMGHFVSEVTKSKISQSHKGKKKSEEHKAKLRGPKSPESRSRMSESAKERMKRDGNLFSYGIKGTHQSSKAGTVHYRSLLERDHFARLDNDPIVLTYEVEPVSIPFITDDGILHHYHPDMLVHYRDGRKVLVEIKPEERFFRFDMSNVLKIGVGIEWARMNDMTFEVWGYKELV